MAKRFFLFFLVFRGVGAGAPSRSMRHESALVGLFYWVGLCPPPPPAMRVLYQIVFWLAHGLIIVQNVPMFQRISLDESINVVTCIWLHLQPPSQSLVESKRHHLQLAFAVLRILFAGLLFLFVHLIKF